jgi:AraC family transcriptional regulator, transcriptional activator of pobA
MANSPLLKIKTITDYHRVMGLPKPEHPLISVIDLETIIHPISQDAFSLVFDFYSISMKKMQGVKIRYGQQQYDFDEGVMFFIAPGQVFGIGTEKGEVVKRTGWLLLVHPDFLWNTPLAATIRQYEFFDYTVNEALFLSDKEKSTIIGLLQTMRQEYHSNIDKFSQDIILSQLGLLLNYADRFYHRQFITRKITNHQVLERLEILLDGYFGAAEIVSKGLPSVAWVADELHVSPGYLSGLLKVLTGLNTQQHIHQKLIDKAKEKLSTTELTVSEIAFELGFEHPQSFSKLFKAKTRLSPLEFRRSFS